MLKFFFKPKSIASSISIFFSHFLAYFRRRFFFAAFFFFWFKISFFFTCFFFQFKIFFYLQNEFCDNKICRQGTLGSQLKICSRICHKTQHLLIFDDFGQKSKKNKKKPVFPKICRQKVMLQLQMTINS